MRQEQVLRSVAVPVAVKHCRYFILPVLSGLLLGVRDIAVFDNTAVLVGFVVVSLSQEVHLVAVATVRTEDGGAEVRYVLVLVVSASVLIV